MTVATDLTNIATALGEVVTPVGYPAIVRTYQGVTEKPPTTSEMPCFLITWKQPAKPEMMTFGGTVKTTTQYIIDFIYKPTGQGTTHDDIADCEQYIQPILTALYAHITLYNSALGQFPIQAGMPMELAFTWSGQKYFGVEFIIQVIRQEKYTFGA